jgi:hypothetical protein
MLIAINPNITKLYSLTEDTAGEEKTVFTLGVLDSLTRAYIDDKHLEITKDLSVNDTAIHDKYVDFVRFGLRGWTFFKDKDGQEIKCETQEVTIPRLGKRTVISDASLQQLDLKWIVELGLEIILINRISKEESKN